MPVVDKLLFALAFVAALGCGLVAGVFFAFSTFVMKALARLPAASGIAAMQSINVVVVNPWFMTAFLGTAAVCLVAVICVPFRWNQPGAAGLLVGGLLYLLGTLWVTIAFNVPRNNALAAVASGDSDGHSLWARYVASWTTWNHVRTAAALAAAVFFSIALVQLSK